MAVGKELVPSPGAGMPPHVASPCARMRPRGRHGEHPGELTEGSAPG